jgi:hypothetical protein
MTVDSTTVAIRPSGGEPLDGVYTYNTNTLSFSPTAPFAVNTTFEIALGASGVKDVSGNPLGQAIIARFATGNSIVIAPPPPEPDAGAMSAGTGGAGAVDAGRGSPGLPVDSGPPVGPLAGAGTGASGGPGPAATGGCSCRIGPRGTQPRPEPLLPLLAATWWLARRRAGCRRTRPGEA